MRTLLPTRLKRSGTLGLIACALACGGKKEREVPPPPPPAQDATPGTWSLEIAATPYRGVTLRTIGEALPPLEAMAKLTEAFTKQTGIKVEVEMYEHSEAVNKVMLDLNSRRGRYDFILQPHRELGRFVKNGHVKE